ncbi:protein LLP-like [Haliotis rufescens]|uniref:protein LLP-like n=1 Tax=Haliotis rufescens TaxID=6454 RepID=UPI001EAF8F8D|nr:protein LLP-like [Haliotis rufescens]
MAKSLRSKWKRKMRNIKREKHAVKEMDRLKRISNLAKQQDEDLKELYEVKKAADIMKGKPKTDVADGDGEMDVDKAQKKINPSTLKDEHGSYPAWMNQRAIKRLKKKQVNKKKKKGGKK